MHVRVFLGLLLAFALIPAANANRPALFAWTQSSETVFHNPVEQQTFLFPESLCSPEPQTGCVYNHTGCNWDVDDFGEAHGAGTLLGTTSTRRCLIADGSSYPGPFNNNKTVYLVLGSKSPRLTVTLTNSQGLAWTAAAVCDSHGCSYPLCTVDLTPGDDPRGPHYLAGFPEIAGSNGGRGVRVDYTLTVTAPKAADVSVWLKVVGGGGC